MQNMKLLDLMHPKAELRVCIVYQPLDDAYYIISNEADTDPTVAYATVQDALRDAANEVDVERGI